MGISLNGLNSGMADTYSSLLGSMSSSDDSGGVSSLLSDYASIKNGSYGKMLKNYYGKLEKQDAEESGKSTKTKAGRVKDSASASAAASLYKSASALSSMNFDDRSEENIGKISDAVSTFIKDYNSLMKSADKSENATVKKQAESLYNSYYTSYKLFSKIGITMNSDKTLSLDEDTLKNKLADTEHGNGATVKTLFGGIGSFADKAVNRASQIYRAAGDGDAVTSSKAKYAGVSSSSKSSSSSGSSSTSSSKDKTVSNASCAAAATTLSKSIEKLSAMNINNNNKEDLYKTFSTFVKDYNDLIKTAGNSSNSNVTNQADYLKGIVGNNKSALSRLGVTVNSDKSLTIDEKKFKEADMGTLKNLFTGTHSFAEKMTDRVNQIYRYASQNDSSSSTSNSSYTSSGSGITAPSMGSMVDTIL